MRKIHLGILLILMMFGHNYVLNQTQTMQKPLENIHNITITEFNLLYSVPSAISILFIIPMGFFYTHLANKLLWTGAIALSVGQLMVSLFGGENKPFYYELLMGGRVFEGIGAQILYMIQGNMASSWMGKYAGIVFILPEFGQIANVFVTPWSYEHLGISNSFFIGFGTCLLSSIAALSIFFGLTRHLKKQATNSEEDIKGVEMTAAISIQTSTDITDDSHLVEREKNQPLNNSSRRQLQQFSLQQINGQPKNLFKTTKITWFVLVLCGINECLYFPFLDNANELVTNRFCIPYEDTGLYLAVPFISAMITSGISSFIIPKVERHKLILYISIIPLVGHSLIYFDINCDSEPTLIVKGILVLGLAFFGMGIGTYYSISFPAVGLSVPSKIRGSAYACMAFFQTISMTLIPIFAGLIIESEQKITTLSQGYKLSSLLFVSICIVGVFVSFLIYCTGGEHSFIYNDEQELENSDNQILMPEKLSQPSTSGQSQNVQ